MIGKGGNFNLKYKKFKLDVRKKFLPVRIVRHWSRFLREAVNTPSLEVFNPPGWGFEQLDLLVSVPAYDGRVGKS